MKHKHTYLYKPSKSPASKVERNTRESLNAHLHTLARCRLLANISYLRPTDMTVSQHVWALSTHARAWIHTIWLVHCCLLKRAALKEALPGFRMSMGRTRNFISGGYHPVHLWDTLGDDHRYRFLYKSTYSESATVWLRRDAEIEKYVSVKITKANRSSEDCSELSDRSWISCLDMTTLMFLTIVSESMIQMDLTCLLSSSVGLSLVDVTSFDINTDLLRAFRRWRVLNFF